MLYFRQKTKQKNLQCQSNYNMTGTFSDTFVKELKETIERLQNDYNGQ
jgi:hypothetical protein